MTLSSLLDKNPHVVLRASAGSGKTTRLTNRIIELLLRNERPSSILATTFTRKAAGEIAIRVFVRLAKAILSSSERDSLKHHVGIPTLSEEMCVRAFKLLIEEQHLLRIQTIDSWAHTLAHLFSLEFSLPTTFTLCSDNEQEHLLEEAFDSLITTLDSTERDILFNALHLERSKGSITRSTIELLSKVRSIVPLLHKVQGGTFLDLPYKAPLPSLSVEDLIISLKNAPLPLNKKGGLPSKKWTDAIETLTRKLFQGAWEDVNSSAIITGLFNDPPSFNNGEYPIELAQVLTQIHTHCRWLIYERLCRYLQSALALSASFSQIVQAYEEEVFSSFFLIIERPGIAIDRVNIS